MYRVYCIALTILMILFGAISFASAEPAPSLARIVTPASDFVVLDYLLVSTARVGRTSYDYTYKASILNNGTDARNVVATLSGGTADTTIIRGTLAFGTVLGASKVQSADTFTIRQNRLADFDPATLSWRFTSDKCVSPILQLPTISTPLISGVSQTIKVGTCYSGTQSLVYHLVSGPAALQVDNSTGQLSWLPPITAEGTSAPVSLSVTDGVTVNQISFAIPVASSSRLSSANIAPLTVEVVEPGSLQGLAVTLPSQVQEGGNSTDVDGTAVAPRLGFYRIPDSQVPSPPQDILRLTDFFRITPVQGVSAKIIVKFPRLQLPDGRYPFELILYTYTRVTADDGAEIWVPNRSSVSVNQDGTAQIEMQAVGSPSFIALADSSPQGSHQALAASADASGATVNCRAKVYFIPNPLPFLPMIEIPWPSHQICTVEGDADFEVHVRDFNDNKWSPAPTIQELVSWVYQSQSALTDLGMSYDNKFNISIHRFSDDEAKFYGYVSSGDNYETLHLNTEDRETPRIFSKDEIQGTSVHEYFHHAQARTKKPNATNLLSLNTNYHQWITEGTARWFEDYLFDDLNTYRLKEGSPLAKILVPGFNASHAGGDRRGYARFALWKLIGDKCGGFSLRDILNGNFSSDRSGMNNLTTYLRSGDWSCNFGDLLGAQNRNNLATALTFYELATVKEDNIRLLDANEDSAAFKFVTGVDAILSPAANSSTNVFGVNPNGARIFTVTSAAAIPAGKEAFIKVTTSNGNLMVSIMQGSIVNPGALDTWLDTTVKNEYVYGSGSNASELTVTVINPSDNAVNVSISSGIRDKITGELTVTGPVAGQSYNQRVINVTGVIPSNLSGIVKSVLIKQPNVTGSTNVAKVVGGNFSGKAVICWGDNTIHLVGLDANGAEVTTTKTITFQGVESSTPTAPNALVKSSMVYVLQWNTATDIDMYVTDSLARTIWYGNRSLEGEGRQDVDNTSGYGPEVTTFFAGGSTPQGNYEVNINYYSGSPVTQYTVDVLLNESVPGEVKGYVFDSSAANRPLTLRNNGGGFPPPASGSSWGADVIKVNCSGTGSSLRCGLR